jgi:hypothetical protein
MCNNTLEKRKLQYLHKWIVFRYWAVTNIDYIHHRTAHRIGMMIVVVWLVAFFVCIAPLLGWKDPQWENRVVHDKSCIVSQDIYYQVIRFRVHSLHFRLPSHFTFLFNGVTLDA